MATPEEVAAAQELLPPNASDYGWDSDRIAEALDSGLIGNTLFLAYWDKVMNQTAEYVDMSESGSSRSLSQVHKNAVAMRKLFQDLADKELSPPAARVTGIRSGVIRRV